MIFFVLPAAPLARPCDLRVPFLLAALLTLGCSTGCTSALTTAYLKGLPWDAGEHAADIHDETAGGPLTDEPDADSDAAGATGEEAAAAARAAAVEEAAGRLAALGALDTATQDALVAALQRTNQEDWPTVVDEFTAVLAATAPRIAAKPEMTPPSVPAPPDATQPAPEPDPLPEPEAVHGADPAAIPSPPSPVTETVQATQRANAAEPEGTDAGAGLTVRNPCFASRVQAWGIFDRFASPHFRPGQEVIVYFELEDLSASESAAGHTTCIDTALTLVTADGRRLHAWHFEPIAETCPSRRRDYFARYVLRFPEDAPPCDCRVEIAVTDTLAGTTATTSLPLSIAVD
jgi:hypothetical protein